MLLDVLDPPQDEALAVVVFSWVELVEWTGEDWRLWLPRRLCVGLRSLPTRPCRYFSVDDLPVVGVSIMGLRRVAIGLAVGGCCELEFWERVYPTVFRQRAGCGQILRTVEQRETRLGKEIRTSDQLSPNAMKGSTPQSCSISAFRFSIMTVHRCVGSCACRVAKGWNTQWRNRTSDNSSRAPFAGRSSN